MTPEGLVTAAPLEGSGSSGESPVLEAPDTVRANEPFEIVVRTYGPTGCWVEAGVVVSSETLSASVTPYDRNLGAEDRSTLCTQEVVRLPRTVTLVFAEEGEAVVLVKGRRVVGGSDVTDDTDATVIEHRLTVLPAE